MEFLLVNKEALINSTRDRFKRDMALVKKMITLIAVTQLTIGSSVAVRRTTPAYDKIILVVSDNTIYKSEGNDSEPLVPLNIPGLRQPYAIDVDLDAGIIFMTDSGQRQIQRASLDGSQFEVVTTTGGGSSSSSGPRGIAVDPNEGEIFWTDLSTRSIEAVKYDGSGRRRVRAVRSSSRFPLSIVVHTKNRKLYWCEGDYIKRCSYNGTGTENTFYAGSSSSSFAGLALNAAENLLYWSRRNYVKSYNLHDRTQSTVYTSRDRYGQDTTMYGIAWFEDKVYMTKTSDHRSSDGTSIGVVSERTSQYRGLPFRGTNPRDIFVGRLTRPDINHGTRCDFETMQCWKLYWSGINPWRRTNNQSTEGAVGPAFDHTTGQITGHYVAVSTSNNTHSSGDIFTFIGPRVNVSRSPQTCFRFWYYMHHVTGGYLKVFFQPDSAEREPLLPLWSTYGQHPDEWIGVQVEMHASSVGRFIFKAIVGDPALFIVAIDDIEFGTCRKGSTLQCNDTSMTVYLDKAALGISASDVIALRQTPCRGYEYDSETMAINTSYTECGTALHEREGAIDFTNQVMILVRSGIRRTNAEIAVNCSLGRNYRTELTYLSHEWVRYLRDEALGNFSITFRQYPTEKFSEPFPVTGYPQQVEEGDYIYLATKIFFTRNTLTLQNARCWATQTPDPSEGMQRTFIIDGCPVVAGVKVHQADEHQGKLRPFSIEAFSFSDDINLIYVHCDVIVCRHSDESACKGDNCSDLSRSQRAVYSRHVRDTSNSGPHTISQGPFIAKPSRISSRDSGQQVWGNILLIVASICCTFLATVIIVVYARRNNKN